MNELYGLVVPSVNGWFLLALLLPFALGALLVTNEAEGLMLQLICNKTNDNVDLTLHLFSNNVTPAEADTAAAYTEVSGGGYASKTLTGASWTVTTGAPSEMSYAEQTFTFTSVPGTATVYGYMVKRGATLLWAERLPAAPFTVAAAGDEVRVTPKFTLE